jgi:hypothetical protein
MEKNFAEMSEIKSALKMLSNKITALESTDEVDEEFINVRFNKFYDRYIINTVHSRLLIFDYLHF